jgi:hypothetical protein
VLTREIADSFDHVLLVDQKTDYSPESGISVLDPAMESLAIPRPVWCSAPDVYVTVTQKMDDGAQQTVLHLLNRQYDFEGEGTAQPATNLTVRVKKAVLGGGVPLRLHGFRENPNLRVTETDSEFSILIDRLTYWSLLHFGPRN